LSLGANSRHILGQHHLCKALLCGTWCAHEAAIRRCVVHPWTAPFTRHAQSPPAFSILTNVPFSVACHVDAVGVGRTDDDKSAMATPFTIATWHRHWLARVDTFKYDMIDILVFILSARNKLPMHPSVKVLVAVRHKQADMLPPDRLRPADHSSCRSARLARERIIGLVPIPEMKPCRLESLQSTWALTG
jgi:hypothetical protein